MNCSVFRSSRKEYTYIYLRAGMNFEDLPPSLLKAFGAPEFVMDLELSPERELASEDINQVLANLAEQGFHLQLPPGDQIGDLI
ncbi:MAG: YcgL domain-containing protein [Xanthomonadales bacterium]|nr:YcgL domain-containing protein [Xanthomonadales bacterium]NIX12918.1 YcgL domain-containing protein [Xanthomonadales bacterium]